MLSLLVLAGAARAQDLEPRSYSNAPVGTNFVLVSYGHSWGGLVFDPSLPVEDAHGRVSTVAPAYFRVFGIAGLSAKVGVVVPYVWGTAEGVVAGDAARADRSGLGDPALRLAVNFVGAPALSPREFAGWRQTTVMGATLSVTAPLGQYDPGRRLNLGTNRWSFRGELGGSRALGRFILEGYGAVRWYADNTEYLQSSTLSQAAVASGQLHVIYQFRPGRWLAADATYYHGGATKRDGEPGRDEQSGTRLGMTLSWPLGKSGSLKLAASTGFYVRAGSDFNAVALAYQYRWLR